jgi:hypothetical protein
MYPKLTEELESVMQAPVAPSATQSTSFSFQLGVLFDNLGHFQAKLIGHFSPI